MWLASTTAIAQVNRPTAIDAPANAAPLVIASEAETIRIKPVAHVVGDAVHAGDVLDLSQAGDELQAACAAIVLSKTDGAATTIEVSYERIAAALAERGVNLGRVLLSGAMVCRVEVLPAAEDQSAPGAGPVETPGILRRATATGDAADSTLAGAIRRAVQEELSELGGQVEIDFERGSGDFLDLTSPQFDFSVRSPARGQLGLREFKVRISQDGRVQRTVSVFGRVRLMRQVVVAEKPLNIGAYIRPDAVRLAPRLFETREDLGIASPQDVIGQRVDRFIAAGEMISPADVRRVDLVQRSRPVSVVSEGAVAVRLNGTALDSGSFGDTVRVRLGTSRSDRRVVRATVTGMATVKLADDAGSEVAAAIGGRP